MNKELEALYEIGEIEYNIVYGNILYTKVVKDKEQYKIIKKALTPPTAKEVCKALSERYNNAGIQYIKDKKSFVYGYLLRTVCCLRKDGTIYWGTDDLTPHLTTMISRFYEELIEKEKK